MRAIRNFFGRLRTSISHLINFLGERTLNWWPVVLAPVVLILAAMVAPIWFTLGLLVGLSIGFLIGTVWRVE